MRNQTTVAPAELAIGALLHRSSDAIHEYLMRRLEADGFGDVRPGLLPVFLHPGPDGRCPTELASILGLTKQALNPILNELENLGYLVRQPSAGDRRQRSVALTDRGSAFIASLAAIHDDIEQHLAARMGASWFAVLRASIAEIPDLMADIPA